MSDKTLKKADMSGIPGRGGWGICPRPWPRCCVSSLAVERVVWVFVNRTAGRFIEAFEKLYGRKPKAEGADGDFKIQVAQDMQMSVGGARYYIRLAAERKAKEK